MLVLEVEAAFNDEDLQMQEWFWVEERGPVSSFISTHPQGES